MEVGASLQTDKQSRPDELLRPDGPAPDYSQDHKRLPDVAALAGAKMLAYEKEVLGFYVTSNPLSHHAETINIFSNINTAQIAETTQEREVIIGGMITKIRYNLTKTGRNAGSKMAVFTLDDLQGQVEVVLFPNTLNQFTKLLANDKIVFVKGRLDFRREKPNVIASELIALDEATDKLAGKVRINLDANDVTKEKVAEIKSICQHHRGKSRRLRGNQNRQRQGLRRRRQAIVRQPRPRLLPRNPPPNWPRKPATNKISKERQKCRSTKTA